MGGEICKRKGFERGPWYEIESIRRDIIRKESRGADATFERDLLKSWAKYEGYEEAASVLAALTGNQNLQGYTQ